MFLILISGRLYLSFRGELRRRNLSIITIITVVILLVHLLQNLNVKLRLSVILSNLVMTISMNKERIGSGFCWMNREFDSRNFRCFPGIEMRRISRWFSGSLNAGKMNQEPQSSKDVNPVAESKTWESFKPIKVSNLRSQLASEKKLTESSRKMITLSTGNHSTSAISKFSGIKRGENHAAVQIQAAFRGYLARKALKALRRLVKLQALVRGSIVRKQNAEALRCMETLLKAQARALRSRMSVQTPKSPLSSHGNQAPATPEKFGSYTDKHDESSTLKDVLYLHGIKSGLNQGGLADDEKNDTFLETDHGKLYLNAPGSSQNLPLLSTPSKISTRSRRSPFTTSPCRISDSRLLFIHETTRGSASKFTMYPNYMANTESSKAKFRSFSAPKQRPKFEKCSPVKRGLR